MAASCSFSVCKLPDPMPRRRAVNSFHSSFPNVAIGVKSAPLSSGMMKTWPTSNESRGCGVSCCALHTRSPHSFLTGRNFQLSDVIEAQQFDRDILNAVFEVARDMEKIEKNSLGSQMLKGYLMATLFYEPSTRTRLSFESAMKRLGGEVLTTENAREFSSAAKGETLEGAFLILLSRHDCYLRLLGFLCCSMPHFADTIRTVEGYSDIIVMRHFESGAAKRAAATAEIPIINAGDGPGQHPTQVKIKTFPHVLCVI